MMHYDEEYEASEEAARRDEGWNADALLGVQFTPSTTVPQFPSTTSPAIPTAGAPVLNFEEARKLAEKNVAEAVRGGTAPSFPNLDEWARSMLAEHRSTVLGPGLSVGMPVTPAEAAALKQADHRGMSAADRKNAPVARGVLDYFPDALLEVANLSRIGNEQHNPGQPMHWAREKSTDHADCIIRHLIDRGTLDTDGVRHAAKVAWRALALLQLEIEASRGSK